MRLSFSLGLMISPSANLALNGVVAATVSAAVTLEIWLTQPCVEERKVDLLPSLPEKVAQHQLTHIDLKQSAFVSGVGPFRSWTQPQDRMQIITNSGGQIGASKIAGSQTAAVDSETTQIGPSV